MNARRKRTKHEVIKMEMMGRGGLWKNEDSVFAGRR